MASDEDKQLTSNFAWNERLHLEIYPVIHRETPYSYVDDLSMINLLYI